MDAFQEVKTLEDLTLPKEGWVELPRKDKALRIPIKAVSLEEQEKLMTLYKSPAAPMQWKRDPNSGKMALVSNEADAAYLDALEQTNRSQSRALTISGLGLEIEGATIDEKWSALSKRLTIGDTAIILSAILEISNVGDDKVEEAKNYLTQP